MNLPDAAPSPNAKEGWGARGGVPFPPILLGAVLLVWPALLNGYPLVFSEDAATDKARMLIEILSAPYDVGERTARLSASVGKHLVEARAA